MIFKVLVEPCQCITNQSKKNNKGEKQWQNNGNNSVNKVTRENFVTNNMITKM